MWFSARPLPCCSLPKYSVTTSWCFQVSLVVSIGCSPSNLILLVAFVLSVDSMSDARWLMPALLTTSKSNSSSYNRHLAHFPEESAEFWNYSKPSWSASAMKRLSHRYGRSNKTACTTDTHTLPVLVGFYSKVVIVC